MNASGRVPEPLNTTDRGRAGEPNADSGTRQRYVPPPVDSSGSTDDTGVHDQAEPVDRYSAWFSTM